MKLKIIFTALCLTLTAAITAQDAVGYNSYIDSARRNIAKNPTVSLEYYIRAFAEKAPRNPVHLYEASVMAARSQQRDLAFMFLRQAAGNGYSDLKHVMENPDFPRLGDERLGKCLDQIGANESGIREIVPVLDSIFEADQSIRKKFTHVIPESEAQKRLMREMTVTDSSNLVLIEKLIAGYGFLGQSLPSKNARNTMWLVIQHAPLEVQRKYLGMLRDAAEKGEIQPSQLAMLEDRISLQTEGYQKYGTQFRQSGNGIELFPLSDPTRVEEYRKAAGLKPLEEYVREMSRLYAPAAGQ